VHKRPYREVSGGRSHAAVTLGEQGWAGGHRFAKNDCAAKLS